MNTENLENLDKFLLNLIDVVWNEATESEAVPSTCWARRMLDNAGYQQFKAEHEKLQELQTDNAKLKQVLSLDNPYPLYEVLEKLIRSTELLLHKHNYDGHGWEEIHHAVKQAKHINEEIKKYITNHGN